MLLKNKVKEKLANGGVALGFFVAADCPANVEAMCLAGAEFIVIDLEHTSMLTNDTDNLVRAAEIYGVTAITRVPEITRTNILKALDVGALGIHVPMVLTEEDARIAANYAKYSPLGNRGAATVRASKWGLVPNYFEQANKETMLIVHCETADTIKNLGKIGNVEGIDVVFIGPMDLSQTLNLTGQFGHPVLEEKISEALSEIKKTKAVPGIMVRNMEEAKKRIEQGFRYIATISDLKMLYNSVKSQVDELNAYLKK